MDKDHSYYPTIPPITIKTSAPNSSNLKRRKSRARNLATTVKTSVATSQKKSSENTSVPHTEIESNNSVINMVVTTTPQKHIFWVESKE